MLVADTSALVAFLSIRDQHNKAVTRVFVAEASSIVVPVAILGELAYVVEKRIGRSAMAAFVDSCQNGGFEFIWQASDLPRIQEFIRQYADLPLGFVDAAVIALAERTSGRIATTDRRHFTVVKANRALELLP